MVDTTSALAAVLAVNNLGIGYLFLARKVVHVKELLQAQAELDKAQKQLAALQAAYTDKVMPAITEANVTMRLMARDPRRQE